VINEGKLNYYAHNNFHLNISAINLDTTIILDQDILVGEELRYTIKNTFLLHPGKSRYI